MELLTLNISPQGMTVMKSFFQFLYRFLVKPIINISIIIISIFTAVILYNSIVLTADFGTFPDWIAACGSILTVVIAWLAYKSAPHWLRQKIDDDAFFDAYNLLLNYSNLEDKIYKLNQAEINISKCVKCFNAENYQPDDVLFLRANFESVITDIKLIFDEIYENESKLRRRGWYVKNDYTFLDGLLGLNRKILGSELERPSVPFQILVSDLHSFSNGYISEEDFTSRAKLYYDSVKTYKAALRQIYKVTFGIKRLKNPILEMFVRY